MILYGNVLMIVLTAKKVFKCDYVAQNSFFFSNLLKWWQETER